ncbi:hypothetical protein Avbf_15755 [Armadillidium vulgare]|nr:hypothetical protein Avbf_15755 [Armadillidium vulgare]
MLFRSTPPTPPSYSAEALKGNRPPYLEQLKIAFTCKAYWLLLIAIGGGIGFTISLATLTQQMLCPLGYTEVFSGMVNGLMLLFGFGGAVASGIVLDRTKLYAEITIYLFGGAAICAIILLEFFLVPDQEAVILVFAILFGIFGEGLFPVGLELAVEATYPVEESITSAFIYLSGQVIGIVIIFVVPALAFERADQTMSICSTDGEYAPLDYTNYKRQKAEIGKQRLLQYQEEMRIANEALRRD